MDSKIKLMLAEDNDELITMLKDHFNKSNKIEVVAVEKHGEKVLSKLMEVKPDVLLTDIILSGKDGFAILEDISKSADVKKPKILVLSSISSEHYVSKAISLGADYYMLKPFDIDNLYNRIIELAGNSLVPTANNFNADVAMAATPVKLTKALDEKISNIFITVGIPAHIKGYQFLREAIKMAIEKPDIINSITKQLYPSIAEHFQTSASKVERAIRHAIEVAWNRGRIENINTLFGVKIYSANDKPTNGEFIALVADKMLIEGV